MEQRWHGGERGEAAAAQSAAGARFCGTAGVIGIYMLANWAYFRVLTPTEVGAHKLVAAEMMQRLMGSWGANAVSIAAMVSIFAALNGSLLSGARVPYAAARDGLFFRAAARVHPAFHTPGISILMLSVKWSSSARKAFRKIRRIIRIL